MCKKLFYSIFVVSLLVMCAQVQADIIFSDDFDHAMMDDWSRINYQGWYEQEILGWPFPGGPWVGKAPCSGGSAAAADKMAR